MKTQVKYLATAMSAAFGVLLLAQCTSDRTDSQTAEKYENLKEDAKKEYAEAKHEVKDAFTSDDKASSNQQENQLKAKESKSNLKEEFADINHEFKEAFVALGENIEQDFDHTQQKLAVARLERISKRLGNRMERLENRLDAENKTFEAADELAQMKVVQAELNVQISEVKNASHANWDNVRKDTRKTCKEANQEIAEQVDEIQEILADSK